MSRYYRDLHARELLSQAEQILLEVNRRRLIEVYVRSDSTDSGMGPGNEMPDGFPRDLAAVSVNHGRLTLVVDESFVRSGGNRER